MQDTNLLEDQPIAWWPTPEVIERAQLTKFMKQVGVSTWDELYEFSIRDVEKFTEEVLKFLDIKFDPPYEKLLDTTNGVEFPTWFERSADTPVRMSVASTRTGAQDSQSSSSDASLAGGTGDADKSVRAPSAGLNITTMCLDRWQMDDMKDQPAVIWEGEEGSVETLTHRALYDLVAKCAAGLRQNGLGKGDAIGIHLPMIPETVVALLAINRIGALAVPVFSGYGVEAIVSRMNAVGARAIFTSLGFQRRGKQVRSAGFEAAGKCPTVETVFLVRPNQKPAKQSRPNEPFDAVHKTAGGDAEAQMSFGIDEVMRSEIEHPSRLVWWAELVGSKDVFAPEPTSAEDPLIILYTSGTTGKPKGIAHTHASFPIKAAQDMAFGTDVGKGTRISWYTDIGWMMGPWLIYGALINGATICIYDGAPDYPTPDRMWEFCAKHKVEVLGISPTLIRSLAAAEGSADTPVRMSVASTRTNANTPASATGTEGLASGSADTPFRMSSSSTRTNADKTDTSNSNDLFAGGTGDADKSVRTPSDGSGGVSERRGWYRHKLPHYDGNETQFITFRLADSLPQSVIEKMKYRLDHDKFIDNSQEYRDMVEEYLDAGSGECILGDPAIAELVESTILHEHGRSCDVKAWVIMPNHAHIMLRPYDGHSLAGIMKRVKGISARKINLLRGQSGTVWQGDYFDRYIRDEDDFRRKLLYIEENPVKAGRVKDAGSWRFSSAYQPQGLDPEASFAGGTGDADKSVRAPNLAPFERHDLSSLRIFASTGEPWNPAPWWWLFEKVGNAKLPIINYSGGTEIAGGILMGNPLLPIKPCSFPAPCPGMDVDILDEDGNSVPDGKVGELVIKQPWIGMARGFWQEKERYLETYWRRFKDIWVHGDWAMRDKDGHWFILGRSDDTLKVAGKRVGPAEVESLLVAHPLVTEAAVIGVPDEVKGTAMVAFVVRSADTPVRMSVAATRTGADDSEPSNDEFSFAGGTGDADKSVRAPSLEAELKALVAKDMGKPLAPSKIFFVSALPKTRNAKVMRRVIRSAYLGEDPGDLSALENPQAVEEIAAVGKDSE